MSDKKNEKQSDTLNDKPVLSMADKIWNEIKDLKIDMFAIPNQKVSDYCKPVTIDPSKLFVTVKASSVLPSLESILSPKYSIERQDKFLIISLIAK